MAEEVLGSGFAKGVEDQLKARSDLFSSKNRTNDQLLYMNSNGAWARLVSSVNTLNAEEVARLTIHKNPILEPGSKNLAYNNVLLGGAKKQNVPIKGGISEDKWHTPIVTTGNFVSEGNLRTNLYHNYESLGFRPLPGIESVNIESKNTYGTIREATVKIIVWTLEDLEVIQTLYLRPGYTLLLEWGHSMYIQSSNKNELKKDGILLYDDFLNVSNNTPRRIEENLIDKRKEADYNYDAMYGFVKNFSWDYRQDGGYDCTVSLISKGSIIESMGVMFDPERRIKTNPDEEKDKESRKSPFHKFFTDLGKITKQTFTKTELLETSKPETYEHLVDFFGVNITNFKAKVAGDDNNNRGQFISLRTLLDFYNNYVAPMDYTQESEEGTGKYKLLKFYTGQTDENSIDNTQPYEKIAKYVTSDFHFSIDPGVCILPKKAKTGKIRKSKLTTGDKVIAAVATGVVGPGAGAVYTASQTNKDLLDLGKVNKLGETLNKKIKVSIKGEVDDVLNIYLSLHFLTVTIGEIADDSDTSQHNMYAFMKKVLGEVNDSLGGINDFDLFNDETEDIWYIIDRKVITVSSTQNNSVIDLTGLRSTITDLSVGSKISSQMASQISIAAQGTGGNTSDNLENILKWNLGTVDRTMKSKADADNSTDTTIAERLEKEQERTEKWAEEVTDMFDEYGLGVFNWNVDYDKDGHENLKPGHKDYCSKYVFDEYYKGSESTKKPVPGTIPVELSFSTIGIGGLKIGQAFKVSPGVLPQKYTDNFGFIITGLSHDLGGNKWTTSIKTQFYDITLPTAEEIEAQQTAGQSNTEGTPEVPLNQTETQGIIPINDDPAPIINPRKIGAQGYDNSPVAISLKSKGSQNGQLNQANASILVYIGEYGGANRYYTNPRTGNPEYMLHPSAFRAFTSWRAELRQKGIPYRVSSAYRTAKHQSKIDSPATAAAPGKSAHGWGGAIDFGNLNRIVGNSGNPSTNLAGRKTEIYKQIAEAGAKYGWYNPWRLSDTAGSVDEIWHFEYWGAV